MAGPHDKQIVPAASAVAVVKSDVTVIPATRGIWVGGGGNIAVIMADLTEVTFSGIAAGTLLPISVVGVDSTNTTATLMIALY